jgi:hypothetical protein
MIKKDHFFSIHLLAKMMLISGTGLFLLNIFSCRSNEPSSLITFPVRKLVHSVTINEKGEIKAKKSYSILTPELQHQSLKIARMLTEGKAVK